MVKQLVFFLVQMIAFSGVMSVLSDYVGIVNEWRLFIFGTILFAANTSCNIAVLSLLEQRKKNKRSDEKVNEDDKNTPE